MGRTRVKRRRTSWASVISLPTHPSYLWINAIGPISANAATSITTIGEAIRVGLRNKAYRYRLTLIAWSAAMRKIVEHRTLPRMPNLFPFMKTVTTSTWGIPFVPQCSTPVNRTGSILTIRVVSTSRNLGAQARASDCGRL